MGLIERLVAQKVLVKEFRAWKEPVESRKVGERSPGRGEAAMSIHVELPIAQHQLGGRDGDIGMLLHVLFQAADHARLGVGVRTEVEEKLAFGFGKGQVGCRGQADIFL